MSLSMHTTNCDSYTISDMAFRNKFPFTGHSTFTLNKIFEAVDLVKGVVFGSIIHKQLSGLDYRIRDIDIFVPTVQSLQALKASLAAMAATKKEQIKYVDRYPCSYKDTYRFTSMDAPSPHGFWQIPQNSLNITAKLPGYARMNINILVLPMAKNKTFLRTACDAITKEFLCNVYFNGKIYHKLKNVVNVEVSHTKISDQDYMNYLRKYITRGVQFSIKDRSNMLKPSVDKFSCAIANYQSKGLVVIPLKRNDTEMAGKAPAVTGWQKLDKTYRFKMTKDIDNIGILCGPNSGIVCIDVDVKDRGLEMFNKMIKIYGNMPETCPTQRTGNGGYHFIFKYDAVRMADMKAKIKCPKLNNRPIGIDMWIQDCQFVISPSVNYATGVKYDWVYPLRNMKLIPDMPEWIYQLYHQENIDDNGRILPPSTPTLPTPVVSSTIAPVVDPIVSSTIAPVVDPDVIPVNVSVTIPDIVYGADRVIDISPSCEQDICEEMSNTKTTYGNKYMLLVIMFLLLSNIAAITFIAINQ